MGGNIISHFVVPLLSGHPLFDFSLSLCLVSWEKEGMEEGKERGNRETFLKREEGREGEEDFRGSGRGEEARIRAK